MISRREILIQSLTAAASVGFGVGSLPRWTFSGKAGDTITIDLRSTAFDP